MPNNRSPIYVFLIVYGMFQGIIDIPPAGDFRGDAGRVFENGFYSCEHLFD